MDVRRRSIFLDRLQRRQTDRTDAFFAALTKYAYRLGVRINIGNIERSQFAQSQPAAVEQFHDGDIAQRHPGRRRSALLLARWGREKFLHLLSGEHERQLLFHLWQLHFLHRITVETFPSCEKLIKGAQRGELQSHVRTRLAVLHQRKKIIAKIVACTVSPWRFVLRAETSERVAIRLECSRRSVPFICEIAQEFLHQRIAAVESTRGVGHFKCDPLNIPLNC